MCPPTYSTSDGSARDLAITQWRNLMDVPLNADGLLASAFLTFGAGTPVGEIYEWFENTFTMDLQTLTGLVSRQHEIPDSLCWPKSNGVAWPKGYIPPKLPVKSVNSQSSFAALVRASQWEDALNHLKNDVPRRSIVPELARAGFVVKFPPNSSLDEIVNILRQSLARRNNTSPIRELSWDDYLAYIQEFMNDSYSLDFQSSKQLLDSRRISVMSGWTQGWDIPRICRFLADSK